MLVLAGSPIYSGAACLSSWAALRSGAGLVTLGVPQSLYPVAAAKIPEVMVAPLPETGGRALSARAFFQIDRLCRKADSLLIGPGLSLDPSTQLLVRRVLRAARVPAVIDADGLAALVGHLDLLKSAQAPFILTPHPGEMARLTGSSVAAVQAGRKKVAKDFSLRYNVTLILKGHRTLVASPHRSLYVNDTGNPGMATAGSGDVLAGMVAAFLAQGLSPYEAARAAVYLHGLAGDLAAREGSPISLIASDIIAYLPKALKRSR